MHGLDILEPGKGDVVFARIPAVEMAISSS